MNLLNTLTKLVTIVLALSPITTYAASTAKVTSKVESAGKQLATDTEDAAITTAVKAKFAVESDIKSFDIHVTTTNHVVYLSGTVDTQLQANKAVEVAQSVKGVNDVDDSKLSVTSSKSYIDDAFTTAKVKGKIMQLESDNVISGKNDLQVETTNGVVHIYGKAASRKDVSAIEKAVEKLNGVKSVKTNIDVK
ncbi:MAG TPA: BON domain-containing protein [Gammaproteobacteria bacterium]|nr:BON domain-containing protein [Gammaproteobacteria bacterium]